MHAEPLSLFCGFYIEKLLDKAFFLFKWHCFTFWCIVDRCKWPSVEKRMQTPDQIQTTTKNKLSMEKCLLLIRIRILPFCILKLYLCTQRVITMQCIKLTIPQIIINQTIKIGTILVIKLVLWRNVFCSLPLSFFYFEAIEATTQQLKIKVEKHVWCCVAGTIYDVDDSFSNSGKVQQALLSMFLVFSVYNVVRGICMFFCDVIWYDAGDGFGFTE